MFKDINILIVYVNAFRFYNSIDKNAKYVYVMNVSYYIDLFLKH